MLNEILKTQLSLEDACKDLPAKFDTALALMNSFLSLPQKLVEENPMALKNAVEYYKDIFESALPPIAIKIKFDPDYLERNYFNILCLLISKGAFDTKDITYTNFDQDYFNALCLSVAKGIYDCVKSIDCKTRFSRSDLAEVQKTIYKIYDLYVNVSLDLDDIPVLQLLSGAILEIDKIFEYGKIQRQETLTQPTDLYVFVGRVYPSITAEEFEENLNRFVQENNLKGDKLFLLPKGFAVKYYV